MSSRPKQSMSELKLRRLLEHNQRLREDLGRPRIRVSEASASLIRYCKTTTDHLVSSLFPSNPYRIQSFPSFFILLLIFSIYAHLLLLSFYLAYFLSLDEGGVLVLTSFCCRSRRCGAPSARTRIPMRRRTMVDVVLCNEKDYIAAAAAMANAPAAKRRAFVFSFAFVHKQVTTGIIASHLAALSTPLISPRRGCTNPGPSPHFLLPTPFSTCRNTAKIQPHTATYVHLHRTHTPPLHIPCRRQAYVVFHSLAFFVYLRSLYLLVYLFITTCLFGVFYPTLFLRFSLYSISPLSAFRPIFFGFFYPFPRPNMPYLSVPARVLLYILLLPCCYASSSFCLLSSHRII